MSEFNIEVQGGSSVRLPTAGKYCEKDIIVTASGGGGTAELLSFYTNELRMFRIKGNETIVETPLLDCLSLNTMHESFHSCTNLISVRLTNTHNVTVWTSCFYNSKNIKTIETLDFSSTTSTSGCFYGCNALVNLKFVEESIKVSLAIPSPVLSDDSIESILKALAPVETQQILTVHQTVYNKILDSEYLSELLFEAMDKGWDISY